MLRKMGAHKIVSLKPAFCKGYSLQGFLPFSVLSNYMILKLYPNLSLFVSSSVLFSRYRGHNFHATVVLNIKYILYDLK